MQLLDLTVAEWLSQCDAFNIGSDARRNRRDTYGFVATPDAVKRAEFSPDGTRVVTAGGNAARVWTVAGKRVAELPHPDVKIATFSPDGNLVVTVASSGDRPLRLWTSSGKELGRLPVLQDVQYVAFSPPRLQGLRLVTASADQTARVWDTRDGKLVATLKHEGRVSFAAFSKDGTQILTLGDDSVVRVWTENGLKLATLQLRARAGAALFDSDTTIITVAGNEFRAWDLGQGQFIGVHPSTPVSARFHPSENRVLTVARDRIARLWAPATKNFVPIGEPNVRLASFSEDGQRVLIWSNSGRIELLGLDGKRSGDLGRVLPPGSAVAARAFRPDRNEQLVRRAPNLNVALFVVDQHVRSVRTECRGWKRCGRGARSIDVKRADRCSVGGEHLQLAVSIKDQKPSRLGFPRRDRLVSAWWSDPSPSCRRS
jgi:WD40 repeat protein